MTPDEWIEKITRLAERDLDDSGFGVSIEVTRAPMGTPRKDEPRWRAYLKRPGEPSGRGLISITGPAYSETLEGVLEVLHERYRANLEANVHRLEEKVEQARKVLE